LIIGFLFIFVVAILSYHAVDNSLSAEDRGLVSCRFRCCLGVSECKNISPFNRKNQIKHRRFFCYIPPYAIYARAIYLCLWIIFKAWAVLSSLQFYTRC